MNLKLFLIRHGETDFNRANIVQGGGIDSDLNATGRAQAASFHAFYHHHKFDGVYCTGLKRTRQSLEGFVPTHGEPIGLPELNEFNWGIIEGKEATPDVVALFSELNARWSRGFLEERIEGGESPMEAWARLSSGLKKIRDAHPTGGRVLICTHGRVLRIILSQTLGYGMARMNLFPHGNTALNVLSWRPNDTFFVERLNDTRHLLA